MGVIMQAFYWDCPKWENQEYQWWNYLTPRMAPLAAAGFTSIWLPPFYKAANIGGPSMGYDPYDYWDLGEFDQKGSIPTWFGTKDQLIALITEAHNHKLDVYADLVFNHNSGADEQELNPITNKMGWTKFTPLSGKFPRNWECFHPSRYETTDGFTFGNLPDLCHRNPDVYTALLEFTRFLLEQLNIDGFRYDCVKGYGGWIVRAIQELRGLRNELSYRPFGVGECWDIDRDILDWIAEANAWSDNPCAAFDFPLRELLRGLCDDYGFSLKNLAPGGVTTYELLAPRASIAIVNSESHFVNGEAHSAEVITTRQAVIATSQPAGAIIRSIPTGPDNTVLANNPALAVTFVENHDIVRNSPVINDKMLAYGYILTHEGYPCVFWQDYYNWNLAGAGAPNGIDALIKAHESNAGGPTHILHVDDDLYIMQRTGAGNQHGLVFVLNNNAEWNGASVKTIWPDNFFQPVAWYSHDHTAAAPEAKSTNEEGITDFWAPPRGYAVYLPVNPNPA